MEYIVLANDVSGINENIETSLLCTVPIPLRNIRLYVARTGHRGRTMLLNGNILTAVVLRSPVVLRYHHQ